MPSPGLLMPFLSGSSPAAVVHAAPLSAWRHPCCGCGGGPGDTSVAYAMCIWHCPGALLVCNQPLTALSKVCLKYHSVNRHGNRNSSAVRSNCKDYSMLPGMAQFASSSGNDGDLIWERWLQSQLEAGEKELPTLPPSMRWKEEDEAYGVGKDFKFRPPSLC